VRQISAEILPCKNALTAPRVRALVVGDTLAIFVYDITKDWGFNMHYEIKSIVNEDLKHVSAFILRSLPFSAETTFSDRDRLERVVDWCDEHIDVADWDLNIGSSGSIYLLFIRTRTSKQQRTMRLFATFSGAVWYDLEALAALDCDE